MNEFWQAEESPSFCFCYEGEWFHVRPGDSDQWTFCPVVIDGGLPTEMKENYYDEVDMQTMLTAMRCSESDLCARISTQMHRVD
ncbi:MAG: hypothetical protein KDC38_12085 [Planctomycetes bacterium]|nr:hypothetical protein [Planctomycetota bacterium]